MAHSANKSKRNTYMSDESWTTSAKKIPSLKQIVRLDRKTNEELESDCEWMKTNKHCDNSQSQIKYHMSRLKQSQHEPPRSSINLGVEVSRLADSKVHLKKSWQIDRKQPQDQRTDLVKKKINQYAKYRFEPTLKIP